MLVGDTCNRRIEVELVGRTGDTGDGPAIGCCGGVTAAVGQSAIGFPVDGVNVDFDRPSQLGHCKVEPSVAVSLEVDRVLLHETPYAGVAESVRHAYLGVGSEYQFDARCKI